MTLQRARLIFIFLLMLVILNEPFIALFRKDKLYLGFPVFYVYIFLIWFTSIVILWKLTREKGKFLSEKSTKNE